MKTKKVGIVVDNYKLPKYIQTLNEKGFSPGAIWPQANNLSSITITVEENQVEEISKICTLLEHQFKSN